MESWNILQIIMEFLVENWKITGDSVKSVIVADLNYMVIWIEELYGNLDRRLSRLNIEEGYLLLDRNCSSKMSTAEDPQLHELDKKCQIQHHTHTYTKNDATARCRFNFPWQECSETWTIYHSSNDFICNVGRICLFKRQKEDAWVNNYHPNLLKLRTENMDIQPCGWNDAIMY